MAASSNPSQHSYMRSLIARDLLMEEWQLVERSGAIVPPGLKGDYLEGDCLVSLYCLSVFTSYYSLVGARARLLVAFLSTKLCF